MNDAKKVNDMTKRLEMEEQRLVQRLQHTYDKEKKAIEQLYQSNAQSPIVLKGA